MTNAELYGYLVAAAVCAFYAALVAIDIAELQGRWKRIAKWIARVLVGYDAVRPGAVRLDRINRNHEPVRLWSHGVKYDGPFEAQRRGDREVE